MSWFPSKAAQLDADSFPPWSCPEKAAPWSRIPTATFSSQSQKLDERRHHRNSNQSLGLPALKGLPVVCGRSCRPAPGWPSSGWCPSFRNAVAAAAEAVDAGGAGAGADGGLLGCCTWCYSGWRRYSVSAAWRSSGEVRGPPRCRCHHVSICSLAKAKGLSSGECLGRSGRNGVWIFRIWFRMKTSFDLIFAHF